MRIIAGSVKGRRLKVPGSRSGVPLLRPTSDRAREAIFSIIGQLVEDAVTLDLYAGTGAFGLEALSRGARSVLFVEHNLTVLADLRRNIELCGFAQQSTVLRRELGRGAFLPEDAATGSFSLVFLDPPYGKGLAAKTLHDLALSGRLSEEAIVVAEENAFADLPERIGSLVLFRQRRYGDTGFWLYLNKGRADCV